ncbi:DoxX family protein [Saccharopolyspora sp. MS10]|uniref:DoxX family protein n=1 Tax=Saccharopolyspora sp. MS10 TaxID=3385973 RepID=UPI00399FE326
MTNHDDRPGSASGNRDDRARRGGNEPAEGPTGTQGLGVRDYDYYDDAAYDAPTSVVDRRDDFYEDIDTRKPFGWNAGADLGLLALRLVIGGIFAVHGAQKLFGVLGGPGPETFARTLSEAGFQQASVLSLVTGGTELGAGVLLVLGLFTPLAAAGIVGVMASAVVSMKLPGPFFDQEGGYEFQVVIVAAALCLMFAGPGRVALDNGRAWFRHPLVTGFSCLLIAGGASAAVLILLRS